jgi:hypothetical protein
MLGVKKLFAMWYAIMKRREERGAKNLNTQTHRSDLRRPWIPPLGT